MYKKKYLIDCSKPEANYKSRETVSLNCSTGPPVVSIRPVRCIVVCGSDRPAAGIRIEMTRFCRLILICPATIKLDRIRIRPGCWWKELHREWQRAGSGHPPPLQDEQSWNAKFANLAPRVHFAWPIRTQPLIRVDCDCCKDSAE